VTLLPILVGVSLSRVPPQKISNTPTFRIQETPQRYTFLSWGDAVEQPKMSTNAEEFFFETLRVAAQAASPLTRKPS